MQNLQKHIIQTEDTNRFCSTGKVFISKKKPVLREQPPIKITSGSFKIANRRGCASDFLFYYEIAAVIGTDKAFKKIDWQKLMDNFGYKESTLYGKFSRLLKIGYCILDEFGYYRLISHDNLDISLGIDLSIKHKRFKINKDEAIATGIQDVIAAFELKWLNQKQEGCERSRISMMQEKNTENVSNQIPITKFTPQLGDRKISDLLGFTSSSTGFSIEKRLEAKGYINIERRVDENGLPLCNIIHINHLSNRTYKSQRYKK